MTDTARSEILNKLRNASPSAYFEPSDFSIMEEVATAPEDRIAKYREVCEAVNTQVFEVEEKNLVADLGNLLEMRGLSRVVYAPATALGKRLDREWQNTDVQLLGYKKAIEDCQDLLFGVDASITTTMGAIARTGSLILWPSKEEPRLMSLTPPVHIAVVQADKFYDSFYQAIEENRWAANMPTNALLISGPSKTSDIEQELCYGVHGPKELIVFIVH